jgi:hypothetical protein
MNMCGSLTDQVLGLLTNNYEFEFWLPEIFIIVNFKTYIINRYIYKLVLILILIINK